MHGCPPAPGRDWSPAVFLRACGTGSRNQLDEMQVEKESSQGAVGHFPGRGGGVACRAPGACPSLPLGLGSRPPHLSPSGCPALGSAVLLLPQASPRPQQGADNPPGQSGISGAQCHPAHSVSGPLITGFFETPDWPRICLCPSLIRDWGRGGTGTGPWLSVALAARLQLKLGVGGPAWDGGRRKLPRLMSPGGSLEFMSQKFLLKSNAGLLEPFSCVKDGCP